MMTKQMNKNPANLSKSKGGVAFRVILVIFIILAGGGGAWYAMRGDEEIIANKGSAYTVSKGDLRISILEGGNLKAKNSVNVECQVEGRSTIVYLVPEGSYVKQGELLVELDSADLEERQTQQEISYENAKADHIQAIEALAIQINQNESDIKQGELEIEFAQMDLDKFIEDKGERDQLVNVLQDDITIAEEKKKRALDKLEWTKKLFDKSFVTRNELDADQLSCDIADFDLQHKSADKRLAEKYDHIKKERQLRSDLEESKKELERIKSRAKSQEAQKIASEKSRSAQLKLQKSRFDKINEQLENCTIIAPQDGLVVYGSSGEGGRYGRREEQIVEEGAEVRNRQTLITLPDVSVMQVDTNVHESVVDRVEAGQLAFVSITTFPEKKYRGIVTKVAILPDSQSRWLNPDLKEYSTDVTMEDENNKLKPGMSAMVEIIIDELHDVVYAPVQSVFRRKDTEVCFVVLNGVIEARQVEVGLDNDKFVEIISGLSVGEQILLYHPTVIDKDIPDPPSEKVLASKDKTGNRDKDGKSSEQDRGKRDRTKDKMGDNPKSSEQRDKTRQGREGFGNRQGREGSGDRKRPGGMGNMSPEMLKAMEKMKDMSKEEKKKFFEKMRAEGKLPPSPGN